MYPLPLVKDQILTVLDFETTGSVAGWPVEPWQLGLVQLKRGRIEPSSAWETLLRVSPGRPFNSRAPGRHAQIRDILAQAPDMADCWAELTPRLIGLPLVAHNVGTERTLLTRFAPLHSFGPWIDTLKLVRHAYPALPSKALEQVIPALGLQTRLEALIPGRAPHDALYDAFASAVLLEYLLSLPGWENLPLHALTLG